MKLSIVTMMYNSSAYIGEFLDRISKTAEKIGLDYEIVLVDDGSPDNSLDEAKTFLGNYESLKIVELSKNHGHHRAMMIGLEHTQGEYVYLTDIDLEEKPEYLELFWKKITDEPDSDVVFGRQPEKKRPFFRKLLSDGFYLFFNFLSDVKISNRDLVSRLIKRIYVDNLLRYQETSIFIPALWADNGFNQTHVSVEKTFDGATTYSLRKRIILAVDAVTAFSSKPLVFVFYTGISISFAALLVILYLIVTKLYFAQPLLGWTSLLASIFLMGGLILFALGIIGIYVAKIHMEVKERPRSIIRSVHGQD